MSSSDVCRRLSDIVENADRIAGYLDGLDARSYAQDEKTIDATERCLERIAEAVTKIDAVEMVSIAPTVPFQCVRGLGNMLRHAYDEIDLRILFGVMTKDVPLLREAALQALKR